MNIMNAVCLASNLPQVSMVQVNFNDLQLSIVLYSSTRKEIKHRDKKQNYFINPQSKPPYKPTGYL